MSDKNVLSQTEIVDLLKNHPDWVVADGVLVREWTFLHFRAAFAFLTEAALLFERQFHHGDVELGYQRVQIRLSSHDVGGLTARDTKMVVALDKI